MPLFPAKSTAFSDAVLAASCFWAFSMLEGLPWGLWKTDLPDTNNSKTLAKIWFTLVLTASVVGIFRFGKYFLLFFVEKGHIPSCWLFQGCSLRGSLNLGWSRLAQWSWRLELLSAALMVRICCSRLSLEKLLKLQTGRRSWSLLTSGRCSGQVAACGQGQGLSSLVLSFLSGSPAL